MEQTFILFIELKILRKRNKIIKEKNYSFYFHLGNSERMVIKNYSVREI